MFEELARARQSTHKEGDVYLTQLIEERKEEDTTAGEAAKQVGEISDKYKYLY